jgi:hypothetical protein
MKDGQMKLKWKCPNCGNPVMEDTTPLTVTIDADIISKDPLCFVCRIYIPSKIISYNFVKG